MSVRVGQVWQHADGNRVEVLEVGPAGPKLDPDAPHTKAVRVRNQEGRLAVFRAAEFVRSWKQVGAS